MPRPSDAYLDSVDPTTWDEREYLRSVAADYWAHLPERAALVNLAEALSHRATRVELTRDRFLMFLLTYLRPMLLTEVDGEQVVTTNDLFLMFVRSTREWLVPCDEPRARRDVWVAPRESGKSSLMFKGIPLWAGAHGHVKFVLAVSHSAPQAKEHLAGVRAQLDRNQLLREDFPRLCVPSRIKGVTEADRESKYKAASGFVMSVYGADGSLLGVKDEDRRPDCIVVDDAEPPEANYSLYQVEQRQKTIVDALFPVNQRARVVWAGTTTRYGSLLHQITRRAAEHPPGVPLPPKAAQSSSDPLSPVVGGYQEEDWIGHERLRVHHVRPIVSNPDGTQRSYWPARWSLEFFADMAPRSRALNYENNPLAATEGVWWDPADFRVQTLPSVSVRVLSVDPGISKSGDPAGVCVVSFSSAARLASVDEAFEMVAKAVDVKATILRLAAAYPDAAVLLWEATQGGTEYPSAVLGQDFTAITGIRVIPIYPQGDKLYRAELLLNRYKRKQVVHRAVHTAFERELLTLPHFARSPNLCDAVSQAIHWIATSAPTSPLQVKVRVSPR